MQSQPGILAPCSASAHYLTLKFTSVHARSALMDLLADQEIDNRIVVGLGPRLATKVPGLRPFPVLPEPHATGESQGDAWLYLRGADPGETLLAAQAWLSRLPPNVVILENIAAFKYGSGRDLSGYEDGTENPKGAEASAAAFVKGGAWAGSSFVATQRWIHDIPLFQHIDEAGRDAIIGRRHRDNEEIADAPRSAHVKRAAQESFSPSAFMLRRSMPYGTTTENGLYFVAFGADLDRYERVLFRMLGRDDGIEDGLFRFSRPVSGGYYWCPPVQDRKLRLPTLAAG